MKNNVLNLIHISIFFSALLLATISFINLAFAQYQGEIGSPTLEEQLQLAKEKINNAQQQGAYGSGTAMFGTNSSVSLIYLAVIAISIGGAASAFFIAGSMKSRSPHRTNQLNMNHDMTSNSQKNYEYVTQEVIELKRIIEDLQRRLMQIS